MPAEIQDRIVGALDQAVDTKIIPSSIVMQKKLEEISSTQAASTETISRTIQETANSTIATMNTLAVEGYASISKLELGIGEVLQGQRRSAESSSAIHKALNDLAIAGSSSSMLIVRRLKQQEWNTTDAIWGHSLETQAQSSSLHRKLNEVDDSIGAVKDALELISKSSHTTESVGTSKANLEIAVRNMLSGIWLLISSLQSLMREIL